METKNENLNKIKKCCDLYKKNIIGFDEYVRLVTTSIIQLNEINKSIKKPSNNGN